MQEEVHARDGGRSEVLLLSVQLAEEGARIATALSDVSDRGEQHAARAAGGVVNRLAFLRVENVDHQAHHAARGIELSRLLVGRVGKLLDEVLVRIAEHVGRGACVAKRQRREVLDEILEQLVGQAILVRPLRVAEDAAEVLLVGGLDAAHGVGEGGADILRRCTHDRPVHLLGNLEAVLVGEVLTVLGEHRRVLLIPDVADAFEEEQRQDVGLPVGAIDRAAPEDVRGLPEMRLKLGQLERVGCGLRGDRERLLRASRRRRRRGGRPCPRRGRRRPFRSLRGRSDRGEQARDDGRFVAAAVVEVELATQLLEAVTGEGRERGVKRSVGGAQGDDQIALARARDRMVELRGERGELVSGKGAEEIFACVHAVTTILPWCAL